VSEASPLQQSSNTAILQELALVLSGISTLEAASNRNATAVAALQATDKVNSSTLTALAAQMTAIQAALSTIQSEIQELTTMSDTVASELTTLQANVTALGTAVATVLADLQTEMGTLTPDQAAAFDAAEAQIATLTGQLNAAGAPAATGTPSAAHPAAHKP
jgi:chromosome segregation ATPase